MQLDNFNNLIPTGQIVTECHSPEPLKLSDTGSEPNDEPGVQFTVNTDLFNKIKDAYSADSIPKLRGIFNYNGADYTCIGFVSPPHGEAPSSICYRLVDRSEFKGDTREGLTVEQRGYHGVLASFRRHEYVLVGPEVTFFEDMSTKHYFKKVGNTWIAENKGGEIIAIANDYNDAALQAERYLEPIATVLNPETENYILNHTYRISFKGNSYADVIAQDINVAIAAAGKSPQDVVEVKVYKSSGKIGTNGGVGAGWSKCTEVINIYTPIDYIPSQEEEHIENMRQRQRCDKCSGYRTDPEHRCLVHRWDCPKGADIDFSTLEIKTAQRQGQPHIIRCSGMQSEGKDLKEAAIAICQKLGIEFDSPTDLTDTLKHNFADSPNRNLIISFLKPEKVATK